MNGIRLGPFILLIRLGPFILLIVPEEGWFGQPKYSTPTKKILLRCVDFCFFFLHSIREAD